MGLFIIAEKMQSELEVCIKGEGGDSRTKLPGIVGLCSATLNPAGLATSEEREGIKKPSHRLITWLETELGDSVLRSPAVRFIR